jgi:hypothetical protein
MMAMLQCAATLLPVFTTGKAVHTLASSVVAVAPSQVACICALPGRPDRHEATRGRL